MNSNKYIALLPEHELEYIFGFKKEEDRAARLLARLLLLKSLEDSGIEISRLDLRHSAYKKPYLANLPDFYFSFAHCRTMTVCFTGPCNLGVDVEEVPDSFDIEHYRSMLSRKEIGYISKKDESADAFCRVWTRKEALIKATGKGFYQPRLSDIEVLNRHTLIESDNYELRTFCTETKTYLSVAYIHRFRNTSIRMQDMSALSDM